MLTHPPCHSALPSAERLKLLRFAASFVWSDLEVADAERRFLLDLAGELGVAGPEVDCLLAAPPLAEHVDPGRVEKPLADAVRGVALRAIAADGRIAPKEMALFALLDDLLPRT